MKNTNKKGFTIVELVIVIAIVAVLAAVLIPTFAGLVKKANESADIQAARQMNTALAVHSAEHGAPKNVADVKKALDDQLVNVEGGLVPISKGYAFYWDSLENEILLVANTDEIKEGWYIITGNAFGEQISVATSAELGAALDKASEGPVSITLTSDVTFDVAGTNSGITATSFVGQNYTTGVAWKAMNVVGDGEVAEIDLNGKTLTLTNTAEIAFYVEGGTLTIKNGTINSSGFQQVIRNTEGTLILTDVVINDASEQCVITARGISDTAITRCTITTSTWQAVATNSNNPSTDGVRISIIDSDITAKNAAYLATAVVINIVADVTIDGCTFEGEQQAMVLRGNNAVVKNSTFIYDYDKADKTVIKYGSGTGVPAASIVLHAGAGYGGNATYTYTFENVTLQARQADDSLSAGDVKAGTSDQGKLIISGVAVSEKQEAVEGSIIVK